jgi:hypothetical protein
MKFFKFSFLLFLSSCVINKIDVTAYKESDFNTPKRIFILTNAVVDNEINEFQTKFCYLLNEKMVSSKIKSDYYISKYNKNDIDPNKITKLKEFKPDYYFEISPITNQSLLMERKDGLIERQGTIYEIVLKDFSNNNIVYRMKLSAASMLSASDGSKKAANKIWNALKEDNIVIQ